MKRVPGEGYSDFHILERQPPTLISSGQRADAF